MGEMSHSNQNRTEKEEKSLKNRRIAVSIEVRHLLPSITHVIDLFRFIIIGQCRSVNQRGRRVKIYI